MTVTNKKIKLKRTEKRNLLIETNRKCTFTFLGFFFF